MSKIITSPTERVQKTVSEAYKSATGQEVIQEEIIYYANQKDKQLSRVKNNLYYNLLGEGGGWSKVETEYKQILQKMKDQIEHKDLSELDIQDRACRLFLQGSLKSGNPYTVSQERLKLLLKGFDKLDTQNEVKIIAMRHGHRKNNDLTELGIQEAQQAGQTFDFGAQDMVVGTHQTTIESLLISLVGGSQGLSPQEAWDILPSAWQQPYKTAQVTEFMFSESTNGIKTLTITTNNHTEAFNENDCKNAYAFISKYSYKKKI